MIKLSGHVSVAPDRGVNFKKKNKAKAIMLELPSATGIALVYTDLLRRTYGPWLRLQFPVYGFHVTLVKGTERYDESVASRFANLEIEISLDPSTLERFALPGREGFWWIKASSPKIDAIRELISVSGDGYGYDPHLTIAREDAVYSRMIEIPDDRYALAFAEEALRLVPDKHRPIYQDLVRFINVGLRFGGSSNQLLTVLNEHVSTPRDAWHHDIIGLFKEIK